MSLWNMGKWTTPVPRRSLPERATSNKCCLTAEDIRRLEARADGLDVLLSIHVSTFLGPGFVVFSVQKLRGLGGTAAEPVDLIRTADRMHYDLASAVKESVDAPAQNCRHVQLGLALLPCRR